MEIVTEWRESVTDSDEGRMRGGGGVAVNSGLSMPLESSADPNLSSLQTTVTPKNYENSRNIATISDHNVEREGKGGGGRAWAYRRVFVVCLCVGIDLFVSKLSILVSLCGSFAMPGLVRLNLINRLVKFN